MKQKIKCIQGQQSAIQLQGNLRESSRRVQSSDGAGSMVVDAYIVERGNPILVELIDLSHLQAA